MPRHRSPFALLILDCDGVVVDSEPITMRVLAGMLSELGVSIETEEAARRFTGHTFARTLELITELLPRFEGRMFSSDDVARGKPFPDLFLFAARHFQVPPSECLVIEDSANGIAAALAAAMSVYGFSGSEAEAEDMLLAAGAHRVFHYMRELPSLASGAR